MLKAITAAFTVFLWGALSYLVDFSCGAINEKAGCCYRYPMVAHVKIEDWVGFPSLIQGGIGRNIKSPEVS